MTVNILIAKLYAKADSLDKKGAYERAYEIRKMAEQVNRAYNEVKEYKG